MWNDLTKRPCINIAARAPHWGCDGSSLNKGLSKGPRRRHGVDESIVQLLGAHECIALGSVQHDTECRRQKRITVRRIPIHGGQLQSRGLLSKTTTLIAI